MGDQADFMDRYAEDGVVCIRKAFSDEWVELARQGIEKNIAQPSPFFRRLDDGNGAFLSDCWSRRHIPEFEQLCQTSPAARIASPALASRSEDRRIGKGWVSPCSSRWSPYH